MQFRFIKGQTIVVGLTGGHHDLAASIALGTDRMLYGNAEESKGFEIEQPTILTYQEGSDDDRSSFVFVLGGFLEDGTNIECTECRRPLALYIKDGQMRRVIMVCPDCQTENPVHASVEPT